MGKKFESARERVEKREYEVSEAVDLVKGIAFAKFDETVDLAVRLGVDPKHADQVVRGTVVLPHGTGKKIKILVFAKGEKEKEALGAGADYVGAEDLIEKISKGWFEFDKTIATPDLMGMVGRIGKILGPRGLMPNPKVGTVTFDIAKVIREMRQGRVEYRVEKAGIVHLPVGKVSFAPSHLVENIMVVFDSIMKARPSTVKGTYVRSVALSSTMGPGVWITPESIRKSAV